MTDMDDKDRQILAILKRDSRTPARSIAQELDMRPSTVHERIKRLQKRGVIRAFTVSVDHEKMGKKLMVFMLVAGTMDTYVDKLDPVSKWVVIPWLRVGKSIDRRTQTFELLRKLFRLRNRLVHFKSSLKPAGDLQEDDRISRAHAEAAIRTVRMAVAALSRLDRTADRDWLREARKAPTS